MHVRARSTNGDQFSRTTSTASRFWSFPKVNDSGHVAATAWPVHVSFQPCLLTVDSWASRSLRPTKEPGAVEFKLAVELELIEQKSSRSRSRQARSPRRARQGRRKSNPRAVRAERKRACARPRMIAASMLLKRVKRGSSPSVAGFRRSQNEPADGIDEAGAAPETGGERHEAFFLSALRGRGAVAHHAEALAVKLLRATCRRGRYPLPESRSSTRLVRVPNTRAWTYR